MAYCPVCGNQVGNKRFCPKCGSEIKKQNNNLNINNNISSNNIEGVFKNIELMPIVIGLIIALIFVGISGFYSYLAIFGAFIGSLVAGYLTKQTYIHALIYGAIIGIFGSIFYWLGGFIFGYFLISSLSGAFIGKYVQLNNGDIKNE